MIFWKWLTTRYIVLYLVFAVIAATMVDWPAIQYKRSRYLLGIFYNGNFENCRDGQAYVAYMRRVIPKDKSYQQYLNACPGI